MLSGYIPCFPAYKKEPGLVVLTTLRSILLLNFYFNSLINKVLATLLHFNGVRVNRISYHRYFILTGIGSCCN